MQENTYEVEACSAYALVAYERRLELDWVVALRVALSGT